MSTAVQPILDRANRPQLKRIRVRSAWEGMMRARHQVRNFEFHTGEPEAVGGDDIAPTPMEYVVAALAGCLTVVAETVAGEQQLTLHSMQIDATATMDRRGFAGTADVSPHFQEVVVRARFGLDDPGAIQALQEEVERRCPAFNLIKDAGVPVVSDWAVTEVAR